MHGVEGPVASIGSRVDVLRSRSRRESTSIGLDVAQEVEALGDMRITGVELGSACVSVDSIRDLVVATLVQRTQIEPDFGDVGIDSDGTGVGIKGVTELVDVVIENTDAAPEGRVATVAIDSLLVRLVGLLVFLAGHVGTTQQVPALGVARI